MNTFLPDQSRISQVHLRTAMLGRAHEFYAGVLGLTVSRESETHLAFSGKPDLTDLLVIHEEPNAPTRPARSIGLYHFALRYATRADLARAYQRLAKVGYPIDGASDHGVSEAIYLSDPDGNGVELYADRPRSQWHWHNDQVKMVTTPLDLDNLLATLPTRSTMSFSTPLPDFGHIHLHVADLSDAEKFYSQFLGLAVTQRSYAGALFFAAGGYHHHIAVNTWAGKTVPPTSSVGLVSYRLAVPVPEILYCLHHRAPLLGYESHMEATDGSNSILQIRDPNGNWLEIQAPPAAIGIQPEFCEQNQIKYE